MTARQAMVAMALPKRVQAGGVEGDGQIAEHARRVENLGPDQVPDHARAQLRKTMRLDTAHVMVQGVMDRPRRLPGIGQAIEVAQNLRAAGVELEVQLPPAAELEQVKANAPPGQEARFIDAHHLQAPIGQRLQPIVEVGEEMPHRPREDGAQPQG
jgi:hypothetical protein